MLHSVSTALIQMAFRFLLIFALLNVAFAGRHAILSKEELYWKSVFPNSPMPKVLRDILPLPGGSVVFNADSMFGVEESKAKYTSTNEGVNADFPNYHYVYKASKKESEAEDTSTNEGVNADFPNYHYVHKAPKKESEAEDTSTNEDVNADFPNYHYGHKASKKESEAHNGPNNKGNKGSLGRKTYHDNSAIKETVYFFEENLLPGTKVNLPKLIRKSGKATFLPQQVSKSMPMSNDKLPEILKNFSLKAESRGAIYVSNTIMNCEREEMRGEKKRCATSLESFVDLGVSMLGKNIKLLSHELEKETKNALFTIGEGVQNLGENDAVCHKMKYPYAVYFCHLIKKTDVYKVPLLGRDGTKANALAVCHKDTSAWSPNHIAFQLTKVKPGSLPLCHFLVRDTIVWVRN